MAVATSLRFFLLANQFLFSIAIIGNQYNQALVAMAGAERVFRLIDLRPTGRMQLTPRTCRTRGISLSNLKSQVSRPEDIPLPDSPSAWPILRSEILD